MDFIRGTLLADGFRTHHDLIAMSASDQRNTVIVELAAQTHAGNALQSASSGSPEGTHHEQ